MTSEIRFILGVLLAFASWPAHAGDSRPKIVCFGDSITKHGYPEELGKLLGGDVVNAGVGGNTTTAALRRLQRDVLDRKPDVVVIFFGTNDSRLDAPKVHVPVDRYVANLREMIGRCEELPARVVLCTVPPINPEPYFTRHAKEPFAVVGGLAQVLETYRAAVLRLGAERSLPVVDLNQRLDAQPGWLSADGVHPTTEGKKIIAKLIAEKVAPLIEKRASEIPADRPAGTRS